MKESTLERDYWADVIRYHLPLPKREYRFAVVLGRQYRLDCFWEPYLLGIELQGLVVERLQGRSIVRGGHGTVPGMIRDMDKLNAAALLGITIMQFCQGHVASGDAIAMTMRALTIRGWKQAPIAQSA